MSVNFINGWRVETEAYGAHPHYQGSPRALPHEAYLKIESDYITWKATITRNVRMKKGQRYVLAFKHFSHIHAVREGDPIADSLQARLVVGNMRHPTNPERLKAKQYQEMLFVFDSDIDVLCAIGVELTSAHANHKSDVQIKRLALDEVPATYGDNQHVALLVPANMRVYPNRSDNAPPDGDPVTTVTPPPTGDVSVNIAWPAFFDAMTVSEIQRVQDGINVLFDVWKRVKSK